MPRITLIAARGRGAGRLRELLESLVDQRGGCRPYFFLGPGEAVWFSNGYSRESHLELRESLARELGSVAVISKLHEIPLAAQLLAWLSAKSGETFVYDEGEEGEYDVFYVALEQPELEGMSPAEAYAVAKIIEGEVMAAAARLGSIAVEDWEGRAVVAVASKALADRLAEVLNGFVVYGRASGRDFCSALRRAAEAAASLALQSPQNR